jgi:ADP-ribosylation factor GTPase-activating protein 1
LFIVISQLKSITTLASAASKIAAKATENATKIGSIATQKVSEISESVNDKVKEGTIVNEFQSQVTTIGSKVSNLF